MNHCDAVIATIIAATVALCCACAAPARPRALPRRKLPTAAILERRLAGLFSRAWELAWDHLRSPQPDSGFVSDYIDPAFNGNLFQWDLCFVTQFAKYGHGVFPAPRMLSNMYAKQQPDGFIPREIKPDGEPFKYGDGLNPPLYAWTEWDTYRLIGDRSRLVDVLPPLIRFHQWINDNRRGDDGLYWFEDSLGSGMDDQPRSGKGWIDLSCQMALDALCLSLIAREVGDEQAGDAFGAEYGRITETINRLLWNPDLRWYEDQGGSDFKSIATFWALLAGVARDDRAEALVQHLTEPREFWRPTPVPSISADSDIYNAPDGGYWRGAVWPPTNYMIVRGLMEAGRPGLAKTIALEYLRSLAIQLRDQGTLFEHCSSERDWGGGVADMVGWAGVGPVAMLIEAVLGIRADAPTNTVTWLPTLRQRHGIQNLTFGGCTASLLCAARAPARDYVIKTEATKPFILRVVTQFSEGTAWRGKRSLGPLENGVARIEVRAGSSEYRISGQPAPDGAPPAQPQNLRVTPSGGGVVLRWQACADEDLAGYDVYRTEDHGWRKISSSLCIWSTYTDENPPHRGCSYAVAAVDLAGNTSAISSPARLPEEGGPESPTGSQESA
jgi:hypothetical protein